MLDRLGRLVATATVLLVLVPACSDADTPSLATTSGEAPTVTAVSPGGSAATELDDAVDALVDRLGPRQAFDAVLSALESGQSPDDIIAAPDLLQAP